MHYHRELIRTHISFSSSEFEDEVTSLDKISRSLEDKFLYFDSKPAFGKEQIWPSGKTQEWPTASGSNVTICDLADGLKERLAKFRLRKEKTVAAIILKIDKEKKLVEIDEEHEDVTIDELREELSPHLPRYVIISYVQKHDDGRVSYPLCFVFFSPPGVSTDLHVMYTGSVTNVLRSLGLTKNFEIRDLEDFDEDWLKKKLAFFR